MLAMTTGRRVIVEETAVDALGYRSQRPGKQAIGQRCGRHVSRQVDHRTFARLGQRHEGTTTLCRSYQAAPFENGVCLRDGADADSKFVCQVAMCMQPAASLKLALKDIVSKSTDKAIRRRGELITQVGSPGRAQSHCQLSKSVL